MDKAKVEYLAREAFWGANDPLWRAIVDIAASQEPGTTSMSLDEAIRIAVENAEELEAVGVLAD